jgi:class 3 adenylate cyclase
MGTMFLQEVDATVWVADVRDFAPLSQQLGPVDLGIALSRFYEHIGAILEKNHGRLVKFIGDGVLGVFVGGEHCARALRAVADATGRLQQFVDDNLHNKLPTLEYAVGAASGTILAGELGTDRLRLYDVIGQPVNQAFRITALATRRGVPNLVDAKTYEGVADTKARPRAIETDAVELDDARFRLFKVEP